MNLLKVFEIFEDDETAMKSFLEKKAAAVAAPPKKKKAVKAMKETE
jgi:hypothetical protein